MLTVEALARIDDEIASLEGEIAGLRRARNLLTENRSDSPAPVYTVPETPKPRAAAPAPATNGHSEAKASRVPFEEWRRRVAHHIRLNGPTRQSVLIDQVDVPGSTLHKVLGSDWFERESDGFHLTTVGHQQLATSHEPGDV